jgi:hypothetical protein
MILVTLYDLLTSVVFHVQIYEEEPILAQFSLLPDFFQSYVSKIYTVSCLPTSGYTSFITESYCVFLSFHLISRLFDYN